MDSSNRKFNILMTLLVIASLSSSYVLTSQLEFKMSFLFDTASENHIKGKTSIEDFRTFAQDKVDRHYSNIQIASEYCLEVKNKGSCLYWISFFTGAESAPNHTKAENKCLKIGKEHMGACFDGFGNGLAEYYKNSSKAARVCREVDSQYRNSCWDGLSGGLGGIFFKNVTRAIKNCNVLKESVRERCYDGLGHGLSSNYYNIPEKMYNGCNKVLKSYKEICFKGLGFNMGLDHSENMEKNIETCERFHNYSSNCMMGLGDSIGEFMSYKNIEMGKEKCLKFEAPKFKRNCIEEIGFGLGRNYINDLDKGVEKCEQLGGNLTLYCIQGFKKTIRRRYGKGEEYMKRCSKLKEYKFNITC